MAKIKIRLFRGVTKPEAVHLLCDAATPAEKATKRSNESDTAFVKRHLDKWAKEHRKVKRIP